MTPAKEPKSKLRLFLRGFGWIAFFPLLFGLAMGLVAMFEGRKAERLRDNGVVAVALITGKDIEISTDSDGDDTTNYYLEFSFIGEAGETNDRTSVGRSFYNGLAVGDETDIRYWREDQDVNEIEPGSTTKTVWITKVISVVLLAAGGAWAYIAWDKGTRAVRVRDRGERRRAQVTEHLRTNVRVNNRPRYRLVWRDSKGAEGKSFMMREDDVAEFPEGSELTVYADPNGRLRPVWQGDVGPARRIGAVRRS